MRRFERITMQPGKMGGRACIRGLRITVATVLDLMASGRTAEEILVHYPYLEAEDIVAALEYAACLAAEDQVVLAGQ